MQKILSTNRKARHDFELLDKYTAGVVLKGHEVKSLRNGGGNFTGAFVTVDSQGEAWLKKFHIRLYEKSTLDGYEPERPRKLLLRKAEIRKITSALNTQGVTVVPLACGLDKGKIKIEIATARGKKKIDKRHDMKARDAKRRIQSALKPR